MPSLLSSIYMDIRNIQAISFPDRQRRQGYCLRSCFGPVVDRLGLISGKTSAPVTLCYPYREYAREEMVYSLLVYATIVGLEMIICYGPYDLTLIQAAMITRQ